jgi:hypothetical protein
MCIFSGSAILFICTCARLYVHVIDWLALTVAGYSSSEEALSSTGRRVRLCRQELGAGCARILNLPPECDVCPVLSSF